jgi:Asp-tRNA(Asn)/Glu-tRNA(Gln) amidotransferase A subunit family amidase
MLIESVPLQPPIDLHQSIQRACDRLDAIDPSIQAFIPEPGRRPRLEAQANALRAQFPDPAQRPPLFGVLVAVKDIFRVDGFPTRAGSALPEALFAGPEASCVTQLKAQGALILGKSVTTEFAYFEPGPTHNPHDLAHTPGGSSSGSAAAVAAGMVPLALGTQTIGSVIRPASYCGIVGFKPSYGRIPTDGVIPISGALDHIGLFTAQVADMRIAASTLCKGWDGSPMDPRRPTIGIPTGPYLEQAEPEALAVMEAQIAQLVRLGYDVRRIPMFEDLDTITTYNRRIMSAEMAAVHRAWFNTYETLYRPRTAGLIREGQRVTAEQLAEAHDAQRSLRQRILNRMADHGVDLWLCPAATSAAPHGLESTGSPAMSLPWTLAGLPSLAVPGGFNAANLPIGVQWIARFGADEQLLAWVESL